MIKCPSCGHGNVDGTQFCEMCGEELEGAKASGAAPTADAASGGNAQSGGLVKCPACDNMNPPDNVVCEVCGTELRPGAASTPPDPNVAPPVTSPATAATATSATPAITPAFTGAATPVTTPFDTSDLSQTADTSTIASAPTPAAADAATATNTDAQAPVVSVSSYDPQAADPLANTGAPVTTLPTSTPDLASPAMLGTTPASPTATLEPGRVKMVVEQGMTVGKQFVLGDVEVLVGREDDEEGIYPDVDLSDQDEGYVHRKHAMLKFENGGLSVTHLGGSNKTRVNNKPLADNTPQPVSIGDKVAFGKVVMRVQSA